MSLRKSKKIVIRTLNYTNKILAYSQNTNCIKGSYNYKKVGSMM